VEVFWFMVFRPVRFTVVSTHNTRHLDIRQGQRILARGMQDRL